MKVRTSISIQYDFITINYDEIRGINILLFTHSMVIKSVKLVATKFRVSRERRTTVQLLLYPRLEA